MLPTVYFSPPHNYCLYTGPGTDPGFLFCFAAVLGGGGGGVEEHYHFLLTSKNEGLISKLTN